MVRRLILACTLCYAARAGAQTIVRGNATGPTANNWIGVSMGIQQGFTVDDGKTNTNWQFSGGEQFALSLEHSLSPGISVGVEFGHTASTLTYSAEPEAVGVSAVCFISCTATASMNQYLAVFHGGTGFALHQVFEGAAGITTFSSFTARANGAALPPTGTETAPTLELGYGFAYAMSERTMIELVEEGQAIFVQDRTAGSSLPLLLTTRISFRVGL
jgi:hypothetical protein